MKSYIDQYIQELEKMIDSKKINKSLVDELLIKINFFNKERIIHLFITLFYALFTILFICHIKESIMLIPYIIHYFRLEARVQYLYKIYDKIKNSD